MIKLCPQCGHPEHLPVKEDGTEGCPIVTGFEAFKDKLGYYHEHCDCDYCKKEIE